MDEQAHGDGGRLPPLLGWLAVLAAWGGIALLLRGGIPGDASGGPAATTPPVTVAEEHASLDGVIERSGAGLVLVSAAAGGPVRVRLHVDAETAAVTPVRAWELLAGIAVQVSLRVGPESTVGTSVRLGSPASVPPPPSADPAVFTGLIAHYDGIHLRLLTRRGEEWVRMAAGAELVRVTPFRPASLQPGQRVRVDGARLDDGSVAVRTLSLR